MSEWFDVDALCEGSSEARLDIGGEGAMSFTKLLEPGKIDYFGALDFGYCEGTKGAVEDLRTSFTFHVPANCAHKICVHV